MRLRPALCLSVLIAAALPALAQDTAPDPQAIVATVDGTPIREADIASQLAGLPAELVKERGAELRKAVLDRLVESTLLVAEAKRQKIDTSPEFLRAVDDFKRSTLMTTLLKQRIDQAVTEKTLRDTYAARKKDLARPAVKANHILLETEAEAREAIQKLDAGADFVKIAKEMSKGADAETGGDLPWFGADQLMPPAIVDAAFALKKGDYTKTPVNTEFGWHVLRVSDRDEARVPAFDDIEAELREDLVNKAVSEMMDGLKKAAAITRADTK
jgi:peptidyl-prolyl cis-trans isomerase C